MAWGGRQWNGSYWKGTKAKPSPKRKVDKKKDKQQPKEAIPHYDADCWVVGSSASSSKQSDGTAAGNMQDITKLLKSVVQAGKIELPPEAMKLLEDSTKEDGRATFSAEQKTLNARRKAFNKVNRLKEAMSKKTERFAAYKQALKEQLATETERFEKDMAEIKENLAKAEADLARIEAGEPEEVTPIEVETLDTLDLFSAYDHVKEKNRLEGELNKSQAHNKIMEAKYMETQRQLSVMQQQMQAMVEQVGIGNAGLTWPTSTGTPPPSQDLTGTSSPQMPAIGPFTRASTARVRDGPYGKDADPKEPKPSKCALQANMNGME